MAYSELIDGQVKIDSSSASVEIINLLRIVYSGATQVELQCDTNGLLFIDQPIKLDNVKTGATQAAAGATVGEVWATASHATLPDNVLMIGV